MEITTRDGKNYTHISNLKGWEKNPRSIDKAAFKRLCEQIRRLGQYKPLLCTADGEVLGGNMRLKAFQDLKISDVWVSIIDPKTDAEKLQYALSDNDRAGYYNEDSLAELLGELEEIDLDLFHVDLGNTLSARDLYDRFRESEEDYFDPDSVPSDSPITQKGDLFQLGQHILMCGDSTSSVDVALLMGQSKANMVFTDPPYNVAYVGGTKNALTIMNDKMSESDFNDFCNGFIHNILTFCKGAIYLCMSSSEWPRIHQLFKEQGGKWSRTIIWVKDRLVLSRADYHNQFEPISILNEEEDEDGMPILYGWPEGEKRIWNGDRKQTDIWRIDRPTVNREHPTMKPIKLCARAVKNSSKEGDIVMDLFGGSGSTLIACEQLNRQARIMELDPHYVDVIITRWEQFTGEKSVKIA